MTRIRTPYFSRMTGRLSLTSQFWCHAFSSARSVDRASGACSLLLHGAIVGVLAAIVFNSDSVDPVSKLDVTFTAEETAGGALDFGEAEIELNLPASFAAQKDNFASVATVPLTAMPESSVAIPSFPDVQSPVTDSVGGARRGQNSTDGKNGATIGQAAGASDGKGKVTFFGNEVHADSVAFVIDASKSMSGGRFQRARQELLNSLEQLKPDQRFFVVFYTDRTFPMFFPDNTIELISADKRNLGRVRVWIEQAQVQGGTRPQAAMAMTLRLKPDVVFFLSDGDIPLDTHGTVLHHNSRSKVHTITFGSDIGAAIMRQIAAKNGGQYRFIPDGF